MTEEQELFYTYEMDSLIYNLNLLSSHQPLFMVTY